MGESGSAATNKASGGVSVAFDTPPALVTWCLGTFHVAVLTVTAVLVLQRGGAVGELLSGFGTALGLGLYAFLWAATWLTTRQGLRAAWRTGHGPTWKTGLGRALVWGGVTGIMFFGGLFAAFLVLLVAQGAGVLATLGVGAVGAVVAALVGSVVGGVLGLIDVALLRTVQVFDAPARP